MNILITGNLSCLTTTLVDELVKRKHRLVLASEDAEKLGVQSDHVTIRAVNPAATIFRDALSSYGFDIVIFLSTREEQLSGESDFNTGHQLDGLRSTLELCKNIKLRHFFYISSTEVYGSGDDPSEKTAPQPSSLNGYTLLAGEQYCLTYHTQLGMNITVVRVPNLYGPEENSGLLFNLIATSTRKNEVTFPACQNTEVSLLHVMDVSDFIIRAIDEEYTPDALVVNLSTSHSIKYLDLARLLQNFFPKTRFHFSENREVHTKPAKVWAAKRIYDWVDTYTFENELESIVNNLGREKQSSKKGFDGIARKLSNYPEFLKWVELIGGVLLIQFLSQVTGTLIQFKYIDFRLLYVVILGSIYGIRTGLYAAALASLSVLYTWTHLGFDWTLLVYNVGNWLPFALYFTAGLITGYYHDKSENQIVNAEKQTKLIYEKYAFLYGVFNDIRDLKDQFRERLLGYRDSYGKIYTITRELDQLQEQAIYLRALNILEENMDNKNIAIYSLEGRLIEGKFTQGRLVASSVSMNGSLPKSLDLSNYPEILDHIEKGTIFQNTSLLPGYPAYLVPVFKNTYPFNLPAALIVIWSVKFEQYSIYYYNRLKVICGLIEASLVRANQFSDANHERIYLPTTRVLTHQAFLDTLKIQVEMKKNKVSDFQLVETENVNGQMKDLYPCLAEGIRTGDIIGVGDKGSYYILLPQADKQSVQMIVQRLARFGVQSKVIEANQVLLE